MQYVANPVKVTALRIDRVTEDTIVVNGAAGTELQLEDGTKFTADAGMTARYTPVEGDYLVTQDDGYRYINPRVVFERKYSPDPHVNVPAFDRTFSDALAALKAGCLVAREAWSRAYWIRMGHGGLSRVRPSVVEQSADYVMYGWTPSQADLFADDWMVIEK